MAFDLLSLIWGKKVRETPNPSPSSSAAPAMWELDLLRSASANGPRVRSDSRRTKRKRHRGEERRIDKEHDAVLVPSDGGCMSGSESDDSDWSVGWLEPHAPEFRCEIDADDSFAVLVPCYGRAHGEQALSSKMHVLCAANLLDDDHSDRNEFIEQWLAD